MHAREGMEVGNEYRGVVSGGQTAKRQQRPDEVSKVDGGAGRLDAGNDVFHTRKKVDLKVRSHAR